MPCSRSGTSRRACVPRACGKFFPSRTCCRAWAVGDTLPLIGYVFSEAWARANPACAQQLPPLPQRDARGILAADDGEWERIRKRTGAKDDAMLHALRDAFRAGIPDPTKDSSDAIHRAFAVLADIGRANAGWRGP